MKPSPKRVALKHHENTHSQRTAAPHKGNKAFNDFYDGHLTAKRGLRRLLKMFRDEDIDTDNARRPLTALRAIRDDDIDQVEEDLKALLAKTA